MPYYSAPPLDAENHRQGKTQSLIGNQRRRLRYRIGASHHRQRRFVERPVARPLDDAGRENMTHPVQREADKDLGALLRALRRIALVLVEVSDQLLLPGRPHAPRALSRTLRGSDRARPLLNSLGTGCRGCFWGDRL